ncbi:hypothetical protein KI387_001061, partial [Taxus chinensis]
LECLCMWYSCVALNFLCEACDSQTAADKVDYEIAICQFERETIDGKHHSLHSPVRLSPSSLGLGRKLDRRLGLVSMALAFSCLNIFSSLNGTESPELYFCLNSLLIVWMEELLAYP